MTVAADLQLSSGVRRRLVARIDGLNYDFWQPHDVAAPTAGTNGWRQPLDVLEVTAEGSTGLDIPSQRVSFGAVELHLRNVYDTSLAKVGSTNDPNATYLLAQLFAQGRWSTGAVAHLRKATDESYLLPNASTIYCTSNADFSSSGVAYVGRYAFSYTGKALASGKYSFTGVTLGVYPAYGTDAFANALRIDPNDEAGHVAGSAITQYPRTMLGRRVGLYVVTLQADGTWPAFGAAELLFAGVADIGQPYDSSTAMFSLRCSSALTALDNTSTGMVSTVGRNLPRGGIDGINIGRDEVLDCTFYTISGFPGAFTPTAKFTVTVPSGHYARPEDLMTALKKAVNAANVGGYQTILYAGFVDGAIALSIYWSNATDFYMEIQPRTNEWSHTLVALGLPQIVQISSMNGVDMSTPAQAPFDSYHPMSYADNGGTLYTTLTKAIIDQGTDAATSAYVTLSRAYKRASITGDSRDPSALVVRYGSSSGAGYLALTLWEQQPLWLSRTAHAGTRRGDGEPCEVRTCLFFSDKTTAHSGPFTSLLPAMLSCGPQNGTYNGAYDEAPPSLSIGIQSALVDTASFVEADAIISGEPLAAREYYVATQSEVPWIDLLQRECVLFGFFLAFSRGKFRLKRMLSAAANLYTETLTADSGAQDVERPTINKSTAHVVNSWQVRPFYDSQKDELSKRSITVNDSDSREELGATKSIKIEHPGLIPPWWTDSEGWITAALNALFSEGAVRPLLGWPLETVDISLGPKYATRIGIGDVVRYQNANHPDPFGSGSMSTDALALVTNLAWDYSRWTARATLAIYARGDLLSVTPWAPAAIVNIEAGWDSGDDSLTLDAHTFGASATDSEDGSVFSEDDVIMLRWTHPTDPSSGETLGPFAVEQYEAASNKLFLKSSPSITLTSGREYAVTYADWTAVVASQKAAGLFQAGLLYKIDSDEAQRYG